MAIRTERFVVTVGEVRAVSRTDSSYHEQVKTADGEYEKGEERHNYTLEIHLYDRGSIFVDYDDDKITRDRDYEVVAAVVK
jgi:hypothetical protein